MKNLIVRINRVFFALFLILQYTIWSCINSNGRADYPISLKEYQNIGGSTFDYYLGYNLFTSLDTGAYIRFGEEFYRLLTAGLPILIITIIWSWGLFAFNRDKDSEKIFDKANISPTAIGITSIISVYYTYYSVVYIVNFWLIANNHR